MFDESTSSLDNESQNKIQKVIEKLSIDHTIIIVAHRLSTIKNAEILKKTGIKKIIMDYILNMLIYTKRKIAIIGESWQIKSTIIVKKTI